MIGDGQALLATVLDNPEDDIARRVFSDWIDEFIGNRAGYWLRWAAELRPVPSDTGKTVCWWREHEGSEFVEDWELPHALFDALCATHQKNGELLFTRYRTLTAAMRDLYFACRFAKPPEE